MLATLLFLTGSAAAQTGTITGTVVDSLEGTPIPGASVLIEGTTQGTATRANGTYTIGNVEPGTYDLRASFVGYASQIVSDVEVPAGEDVTVNFGLRRTEVGLEEVVVVGYGERQREDLTGAISSVTSEELQSAPITTVEEGLQGRAAGVQVIKSSGAPGSPITVRIRGSNSIQGGNDPLYVIDGVPVTSNALEASSGVLLNDAPNPTPPNPLVGINPEDIESIEILKDASATAIYGARASNGVVLITTKQGQAGRSRVAFNAHYGSQNVRKQLDLLDTEGYVNMVNQAFVNADEEPFFSEDEIGSLPDVDWQDEIFRRGVEQNYQLSFNGGNEATQFALSGNYLDQEGVVVGSALKRYSFRAKIGHDFSDLFRTGGSFTASRTDTDVTPTSGPGFEAPSIIRTALTTPPIARVRNEDGTYNVINPRNGQAFTNPVGAALESTNEDQKDRFLGNAFGEFKFFEGGLTARVSAGVDYLGNSQEVYSPSTFPPGSFFGGEARRGNLETLTWLNENTLNYARVFGGGHDVDLLAGVTFQGSRTENLVTGSRGFPNDILRQNALQTGSERNQPFSGVTEWGLVSYLSRANYIYDDRYLLTVTGRVDGSSRFGSGNEYGFFPSAALAWRVSEEAFMDDQDLISNLKIRTSYGRTGNQDIGTYQSLALLDASLPYVFGSRRSTGFIPDRVANPALKWETTDQFDVGLDLGLFENRISLTADYYYKDTSDLLLNLILPYTSGFTSALQNIGSVENRGFEVSLNTVNFAGDFEWTTDFNLSFNRNEVVELGEQTDEIIAPAAGARSGNLNLSPSILREGEPIGSFYGLEFTGIEDGQYTYRDQNDDGMINGEDRTIIGNAQPDYVGGMTNRFAYGGLSLTVFFNWSVGGDIYNFNRALLYTAGGGNNQVADVLDGPSDRIPAPNINNSLSQDSDIFIEDGSYLRLKNVRLAYNLPLSLIGVGNYARDVQLYVSGQNLLTFTDYSGFDPEVSEFGTNNLAQGIDYGTYPQVRQYTIGFRVGL